MHPHPCSFRDPLERSQVQTRSSREQTAKLSFSIDCCQRKKKRTKAKQDHSFFSQLSKLEESNTIDHHNKFVIKFPAINQPNQSHQASLAPSSLRFIDIIKKENSPKLKCRQPIKLNNLSLCENRQFEKKQSRNQKMNQQQIVGNFLDEKYKNTHKCQKYNYQAKNLAGQESLESEGTKLFEHLINDQELGEIFIKVVNLDKLKDVHKQVLGQIFNKRFTISQNYLRLSHRNLNIEHRHFNRMKYHYIISMMKFKTETSTLFQVCSSIEGYRESILGQETIVEQLGGLPGVLKVAKVMYGKIFADYILGIFFFDIDLDTQAYKFGRLFNQILNTADSPNYSLDVMRERHLKYELTYVHYSFFKFYLGQALYEANAGLDKIVLILSILDGYKCAVLNVDSIENLLIKKYGSFDDFVLQFVRNCSKDKVLAPLLIQRGYERFLQHYKNMFYYLFNRYQNGITYRDLMSIHQVQRETFDAVKQQTLKLVYQVSPSTIVQSDFEEEWEELDTLLIKKQFPYQIAGGWRKLDQFKKILALNLSQQGSIVKILTNYETSPEQFGSRFVDFLLRGLRYYKKTDIQVIHQRLKINKHIFDMLVFVMNKQKQNIQAIQKSIEEFNPNLGWIINIVKMYEEYIVQF